MNRRDRHRLLVDRLSQIERECAAGLGRRESIDEFAAELRGVQVKLFGSRPRARRGDGGKNKILSYLQARVGKSVHGEELAEASGIQEWARRVRELRVQDGYEITEVGSSTYRLETSRPNLQRKSPMSFADSLAPAWSASLRCSMQMSGKS